MMEQSLSPNPVARVLVLGFDSRAFLTVVRSLGRYGLEVHVSGCPIDAVARHSRYVNMAHELPSPAESPDAWLAAMQELLKRFNYSLVIPCDDPSLIVLQRYHRDLEPFARLAILSDHAFSVTSDKALTRELASGLGVPVPQETRVTTSTDLLELAARFGYPLVLKPSRSFNPDELKMKRMVQVVRDESQLLSVAQDMLQQGEVLAQGHVPGRGVGVEVLAHDGTVSVVFQHERVHEPLDGGGSSYRVSVNPSAHLVDATTKMLATLKYTGVAMVEFKEDKTSGQWTLIEINGRFWGSLPLAVAAGADFPRFLYQLLAEGQRTFPAHFRNGLYARNVLNDVRWMIANLKADKADPTLMTRPVSSLILELKNLLTGNERWDTFTLDDPYPAYLELKEFVTHTAQYIKKHIMNRMGKLLPLRLYWRWQARRALGASKNILIVCKGNICRSPLAAAMLAAHAPKDVKVVSAGYYPKAGRSSPQTAIEAAKSLGIDLAEHRSRIISDQDISGADVIFVFDWENWEWMSANYPTARKKMHFVGALDVEYPLYISDPYGGTLSTFVSCYTNIQKCLQYGSTQAWADSRK